MGIGRFVRQFVSVRRFGKDESRWWVYAGRPRFDPIEQYHHFPIKLVVEFAGPGPRAGFKYSRDEDHTLCLSLIGTIYVSWDRRVGYDWPGREWGVMLWGEHLTLNWACDDSEEGYRADEKGRRRWLPKSGWKHSIFLMDAIFGRRDYHRKEVRREALTLTMPEGDYRADCLLTHCTWTRPRWPWRPVSFSLDRAEIDFDPPVGIPGKGENSYDCDDDATFSLTTPLKHGSLRATLDEFALDTLRTRQQRGGLNWQPATGWEGVAAD